MDEKKENIDINTDVQETEEREDEQKKSYEELVAELAKTKAEAERLRISIDRTSSEAADYKRKYREKLSEEEAAAETQRERDEYVRGLEKQIKTNDAFKRYTDLGMNTELAMQTAQFDVDGDTENVFKNMKTFQSSLLDAEKAKWLGGRKEIHADNHESADEITAEDFSKMSYKQRVELANKNPDLYKKLKG